ANAYKPHPERIRLVAACDPVPDAVARARDEYSVPLGFGSIAEAVAGAAVERRFAPVIDNFHFQDYGDGEWKVLGRGDVDFGPIYDAIHEIGFDGWVCADEESGAYVDGALASCYQMLANGLSGDLKG